MEIRANFSEDKLVVNADPDKLVRVLENLINNAMTYGLSLIHIFDGQ